MWVDVSVDQGTVELTSGTAGSCLGTSKRWVTMFHLDRELFEGTTYAGTQVDGVSATDLGSIDGWATWSADGYELTNAWNITPTTTTTTIWSDPDYVCDVASGTPNTTGMPSDVAATLEAIHHAASQCDLRALLDLTDESFTANFGGGTPEKKWGDELSRPEETLEACACGPAGLFQRLVVIAESTPGVKDYGNSGLYYTWPGLFALDDLNSADHALLLTRHSLARWGRDCGDSS